MPFLRLIPTLACTLLAMCSGASALAQGTSPDRPVKVIVALPAGGSADMIARVVRSMATILGILMKRISYSGHQGPVIECWRAQQILVNAHHFAGALNGLPQGGGHLQNLIR